MRVQGKTHPVRTFWWDRARPIDADLHPLSAVIFDVDALADVDDDGDPVPKDGLIDLVMSLFGAGIWVVVVSTRRRECTQALVHQLIGHGVIETLVTVDDVSEPADETELYRLALWELGIPPRSALAFEGCARAARAAVDAGLPTLVVADGYSDGHASADDCRRLHRRWWVRRKRSAAA